MKNAWNAQGRIYMDERITPRRFAAGLPEDIPRHWLPGNEFVSSLLNAYTILVPANEAFYIRTLNACLPHVRDETLLGRCQDFIRQEAHTAWRTSATGTIWMRRATHTVGSSAWSTVGSFG